MGQSKKAQAAVEKGVISESPKLRVRDRIMQTASDLFYCRGIRAVGVDTIASEAGTNKMSFYRSFASKDELVAEYLRAEIEDDTAIAGSILAEDYVGLRADGTTSAKADVLNHLDRHERRRDPYLITATNMREHLFGDTACVTYTKIYTKPGRQAAYSENVLHMLIRRNGIWRLQLSSPLPAGRQ